MSPRTPTRQINVPVGGLQAALNAATCGDELLLATGSVHVGHHGLPPRACAANPIQIRTAGALPSPGTRVSPAIATNFAKIVSGNCDAPIWARNGASGYRITAVEVYSTCTEYIGTVYLGGDGRERFNRDSLVTDIVLDRVYLHGLPDQKNRRCLAMNGRRLAVINSYLSKCQSPDTDAQAVWISYGPGPYLIENNYLEGTGENILIGGSDSPSADMLPQDITIRRNFINKPEEWRLNPRWLVKNLLELKVGVRVLIEGNVFENSWSAGHTGFFGGFVSMNQSGTAPWSQVADVTFRKNYVRHSGSGWMTAATGTPNATPTARVVVEDNVFEDIGRLDLRSDGRMAQISGPMADLRIAHNTFLHTPGGAANSAIYFAYGPITRGTITDNIFTAGTYGIAGDGIGQGSTALAYYLPSGLFAGNAFVGPVSWPRPANTFFLPDLASVGFDAQLRLLATSPLKGRATDGGDPGARIDALLAATAGMKP